MNQHNYIVYTSVHTEYVYIYLGGSVDFMQFAYVNFICVISRILPSEFFILPLLCRDCFISFFFLFLHMSLGFCRNECVAARNYAAGCA